jgi:hypothetical protein
MVTLLPDYPEERRAFKQDIDNAKSEMTSILKAAFPDVVFIFQSFKVFAYPNPTDMSAVLHVKFPSGALCANCAQELESYIEGMYFKINNRVRKADMSFTSKYMDVGLSTYQLTFKYTVKDYKNEVGHE